MIIHKEIHGNELYVYMNGELLYKRWLDQGYGMIFQTNGWGVFRPKFETWQHITDGGESKSDN